MVGVLLGSVLVPASSTASARSLSTGVRDYLEAYPCSAFTLKQSPPEQVACTGYRGAQARISIPVPYIARVYPQYPVVGLPVILGTGWYPASFGHTSAPRRDLITADTRVIGYQVELMVRAVSFDQSGHNRLYKNKERGKALVVGYKETLGRPCSLSTLVTVHKWFGGIKGELCGIDHENKTGYKGPKSIHYEIAGAGEPDWFWGLSQVTPFRLGTTSWKGEPAFAVEISSQWLIFARSRWDKLEQREKVDTIEECAWVTNPVTGINEWICQDVDVYEWKDYGAGEGPWRPLVQRISTWTLAPDRATFVKVYPLLIYQSQPLLQAP